MGLGKLIKNLSLSTDLVAATPAATPGSAPSKRQIFQSRLNRGPNLGSMFVLEKWISPHMFPEGEDGGKTSEFDAVKQAWDAAKGDAGKVREKFEQHWKTWISDDDWNWLKEVGVTSVRVPIGYWMVDNGKFTDGTPFSDYSKVYANAWTIFKEVVLAKAAQKDIGVLVDLHGLPGGANGADHSGTTSGKAKLWDSNTFQVQSIKVLKYLAENLAKQDNVVGLQILNEAPHEGGDGGTQKSFYLKAINEIRSVNKEIPLVISDGWDCGKWINIIKGLEEQLTKERGEPASLGVIVDTHVYRCFSDDDKNKSPQQLIDSVTEAIPQSSDVDVMVGEFSCVLDGQSWDKHQGQHPREEMVKRYGQCECDHFNQRAAGYYFWTYKFQYGGGGEWGFREMLEHGSLDTAFRLHYPSDRDPTDNYYQQALDHRLGEALKSHSAYWNSQDQNRDWEHWRFEAGFKRAWEDSRAFDKVNHSQIGRLAAWRAARALEHVRDKGAGGHGGMVWVYNTGFEQGVRAFLETRDYAYRG